MAMKALTRWRGGGMAALVLGALLLTLLTTENPAPADAEKAVALPSDLAKIPSDGMLVLSGRVADLWGSELIKPAREKYRKEIDKEVKEFQEHFGLSPEQIERMTLLVLALPPSSREPLFVRTVKPYDIAKIVAAIKHVKVKKYKDKMLYVGDKDWTIYPLDDRSLVYGDLLGVQGLIDHPQPKTEGNLAAALRLAADKRSLVLGMNVKRFNDIISGNQLPGEVEPFLPLLQARSATLSVDLAADSSADVALTFAADKDAKAAIKPAEAGIALLRAGFDSILAKLSKDKDTKDLVRALQQLQEPLKATRIEQKDAALHASIKVKIDTAAAHVALIQAVQKMRESASRAQSQNNLKQLTLAMVNLADTQRGLLPAHAVYSKDGKPLLSWRVMILPYVEGQELYQQFHLNEPWDSEHNKKLLAKMPNVYAHPQDEKTLQEHTTHYQAFVGKGAFFEGKQGLRYPASITDGTSLTIMFVEASKAVPWTKPEDIPFDPQKPLPKLGLPGLSYFMAAMCDGSVHAVSQGVAKETLRAAITRNAGDILGADW